MHVDRFSSTYRWASLPHMVGSSLPCNKRGVCVCVCVCKRLHMATDSALLQFAKLSIALCSQPFCSPVATASASDMNGSGDVYRTEGPTSWRYYWSQVNNHWQRVWFPVTRAWLLERARKDRNQALQQQHLLQSLQHPQDAAANVTSTATDSNTTSITRKRKRSRTP